MRWCLTALFLILAAPALAAPSALATDPPQDKAHPASLAYVRIPSHGALLNGVLYTAAGAGPHPTVILFHGLPGNEQNLDLAQAIRRAGFTVLTLHYRGSWGSPGSFSFAHCAQDSDAAIAFLRANAAKFHLDPARIFVAGHSMGGFMAASAAAHDPNIAGLVMISAANLGAIGREVRDPARRKFWIDDEFRDDVYPLAGITADKLVDEAKAHAGAWDIGAWAPEIGKRPVLIITSDDGLAPHVAPLAKALGGQASQVHFADDHSYSGHRIGLETVILDWLAKR